MLLTTNDIHEIVARFSLESLVRRARGEQEPDVNEIGEKILNDIRKNATQD